MMELGNVMPAVLSRMPGGMKKKLLRTVQLGLTRAGVRFHCNICGERSAFTADVFYREAPSCSHCQSSIRMRAVMAALSRELFGRVMPLAQFPVSKGIVGRGLSDWHTYGKVLQEKFSYENTFFHQEPRLDIMEAPKELAGSLDFLISSDVFEHVPPPVGTALINSWRLLKPGGLIVLTVPYFSGHAGREHFPDLYRYAIEGEGGDAVLTNETRDGRRQTFRDLRFHGGDGATLEMRQFDKQRLYKELTVAGFTDIQVHWQPQFGQGIFWWHNSSLPITARRPG
jgi:SAM-dependent methyltransferase